jgi:hypothetical protein
LLTRPWCRSIDEEAWLARLAAYGLPGAPPIDGLPEDASDLLFHTARHKLIGMLAAAVAEGGVTLEDDGIAQVARAHEGAMRESLLLEEVLLEALTVLDEAGIDHRVLKGSALAHTVHPDPVERSYGDNDILLDLGDVDRGVAALIEAGAVRPMPPLSPTFDRGFAKSVTLCWHGPSELDIHRTLAAGPYGHTIRLADLTRDPVEFALAGRMIRTLPPDLHLLHGAIHVALGDVEARLGNVGDLALLAAHPEVDLDTVAAAQEWQCAAPVAVGLRTTAELGHDRTPLEDWAHEYEVSSLDRRRLAAYADRDGRFRRQARASRRVLSWRDRVAFSRALLVPSRANRAARDRSQPMSLRGRQPD